MSQKRYLQIVNFDEQLHYKDKNPIWIKLYCSLLDDYEFAQIADQTKFHAVGLMILAARLNNRLPDDEAWLRQKINANGKINLKLLLEIKFLEVIKGARKNRKLSLNASNSKKTNGDLSRAVFEDSENLSSAEQNRTEEKRKEHNTTQQSENGRAEADATNVVVCDFSKSSETQSENQSSFLNKNSAGSGDQSEFSLEECLRYVEHCQRDGQAVVNPKGLANTLYKTRSSDAFIRAALYPEKQSEIDRRIFGEPRRFHDEPCSVCFGAKMADADGKGYRACVHCKNERGKSTGLEPETTGEMEDENQD